MGGIYGCGCKEVYRYPQFLNEQKVGMLQKKADTEDVDSEVDTSSFRGGSFTGRSVLPHIFFAKKDRISP